MRNKITCAAQKLSQLDPSMIEAVVTPEAFSIGRQYAIEHRAQILEVDETSLNSSVIGTHGLYAQSLRLKGGHLFTKCSCPLTEQPFCRHCVSALLAHYYRAHQQEIVPPAAEPKGSPKTVIVESVKEAAAAASSSSTPQPKEPRSPSLDLGLREVTEFVEWMQPAVAAMECTEELPSIPERTSAQVRRWIEAVQSLDERGRGGEALVRAQLEEIKALHAQVGRLTQDLDTATRATKDAQAAGEELRQELDQTKGTVQRLASIELEQQALETRLQALLGELRNKGNEVERLASTLKEVSDALKRAGS